MTLSYAASLRCIHSKVSPFLPDSAKLAFHSVKEGDMAIRLSAKGWNNVLIFAVLAFIALFQLSHNQLFKSSESHSAPVDASAVIMEVKLPMRQFQRLGSGWRSSDPLWDQERIEKFLTVFQQVYPHQLADNLPLTRPVIQLLLLAHADPVVLFVDLERGLVYQANQNWAWMIPEPLLASIAAGLQP